MIKRILFALPLLLSSPLASGQVLHWGDFKDGSVEPLVIDFNTKDGTGVPATATGVTLAVRELGTTTEDTDCITFNDDADGLVGYHEATINLADSYFVPGKRYSVIITAGTCGGVNLFPTKVATFSLDQYVSFENVLDTPEGPPGPNPTYAEAISWLCWLSQAKSTTTGSWRFFYAPDEATVISEEPLADDDTTFTKGQAGEP